jgi:hypothetical protein
MALGHATARGVSIEADAGRDSRRKPVENWRGVSRRVENGRASTRASRWLAGVAACLALGCDPNVVVGDWSCPWPARVTDGPDAGTTLMPETGPVAVPWSTGFEQGFCDYNHALGYCYSNTDASYLIVSSPAHSGQQAAAFTVTSAAGKDGLQARCVREGTMPVDAYYSAWFYVPALATVKGNSNWNLVHIQGSDGTSLHGLWDVSLQNTNDGGLELYLFDFLRMTQHLPATTTKIPIGSWFQITLRWRRASDKTGEFDLYQDGALLVPLTSIITDDSIWSQWYIGNLASNLSPPDSTVYVDDVAIRPAP